MTYNILGDNMEYFIEIIIYLFFTFGIISFCEKLYFSFFNFKIQKYKKEDSGLVTLKIKIDKYEEYIEEVLKNLMYGDYDNLQYVIDKIEIITDKESANKIKESIWYSKNIELIVEK